MLVEYLQCFYFLFNSMLYDRKSLYDVGTHQRLICSNSNVKSIIFQNCLFYRLSPLFQLYYLSDKLSPMQDLPNTPGQQLRNKFTRDPMVQLIYHDDQYINKLINCGLKPNTNLLPAYFALKNGLLYPGLATKALINQKEVLVTVPQKLILSSMKALQQPQLQEVFQDDFYKEQVTWQSRVLLTYCLFILQQKDESNIFYEMVKHMPKQIDIPLSWPEEQLAEFKDKNIESAIKSDQQSFEEQWRLFQQTQLKYQKLKGDCFTKQNYLWIFTHIISRCFGNKIDFTSFVPFCQFFNHHSSSVDYKINKNKAEQQLISDEQTSELSSQGSHESREYLEQNQFAYYDVDPVFYKWNKDECYKLKKNEKAVVNKHVTQLMKRVNEEVDWGDFSILFVGHFLERVNLMESEYLSGRKGFDLSVRNLQQLKQSLDKYIQSVAYFYTQKNKSKYSYKINQNVTHQILNQPFSRPLPKQYSPKYLSFQLMTQKSDRFNPLNQVFFCYGRKSNRTLLLRYGFAIQGNKHEHVWVSYDLSQKLKFMPDIMKHVQTLGLSLKRKFRIRYTRLNLDLIVFWRLLNWNLFGPNTISEIFHTKEITKERQILEQIKDFLLANLEKYENLQEKDLEDKSLNYHQYFIKVYHVQKKRILLRQVELFDKLISILTRVIQNQPLHSSLATLTKAEQYMCRFYLQSIKAQ